MFIKERKFLFTLTPGMNVINNFRGDLHREPCIVLFLKIYNTSDYSQFNFYIIRKQLNQPMTYEANLCDNNLIDISWEANNFFIMTYRGTRNLQLMFNYQCL